MLGWLIHRCYTWVERIVKLLKLVLQQYCIFDGSLLTQEANMYTAKCATCVLMKTTTHVLQLWHNWPCRAYYSVATVCDE